MIDTGHLLPLDVLAQSISIGFPVFVEVLNLHALLRADGSAAPAPPSPGAAPRHKPTHRDQSLTAPAPDARYSRPTSRRATG